MAAFDFPSAPVVGQEYVLNGVLYTWTGETWVFNRFVGPPNPKPKVQIKRTDINNHPPAVLDPGELAVEMGVPLRLWVGVPDSIDPSKKRVLVDSSFTLVDAPSDGKTYGRKNGAWVDFDTVLATALAGYMLKAGGQTVTGGFATVPANIGNLVSFTPNPLLGNYQYGVNNAAFTMNAPTVDCAIDIRINNAAGAGGITFTGFTVGASVGDPLTTTVGHYFIISIRRIGGISTYQVKALQ